MTDEDRERARNTSNIIGRILNECNAAIRNVEREWVKEEYDLFTDPKVTDAVHDFIRMLPPIIEKAEIVCDELHKYRTR